METSQIRQTILSILTSRMHGRNSQTSFQSDETIIKIIKTAQKILQSEIYLKNPSFSYYWFSHAYTYMETGVLGIVSYVLFFVNNFIYSFKLKRNKGMSKWGLFGMIITVSAVILFMYNQSLMIPSGYMMYFAFSVPYVMNNKNDKTQSKRAWRYIYLDYKIMRKHICRTV